MQTIYEPIPENGFELCHPVHDADWDGLKYLIDGSPRGTSWTPLAFQLVTEDQGAALRRSDSPGLMSCYLIFRDSAIAAMGSLLESNGELLPIQCGRETLFLFNPPRITGALDVPETDIARFDDGRIMFINRFAFHESVVAGRDVFRVSELLASPVFLSQRFVDAWRARKLHGLEFLPFPAREPTGAAAEPE